MALYTLTFILYFNLHIPRQQARRQKTDQNGSRHSPNLVSS
jgi:hypothetical protein